MFNAGKVESVEKLFSILSSATVNISLRRSAAEQLSVVLQSELFVKYYIAFRYNPITVSVLQTVML